MAPFSPPKAILMAPYQVLQVYRMNSLQSNGDCKGLPEPAERGAEAATTAQIGLLRHTTGICLGHPRNPQPDEHVLVLSPLHSQDYPQTCSNVAPGQKGSYAYTTHRDPRH